MQGYKRYGVWMGNGATPMLMHMHKLEPFNILSRICLAHLESDTTAHISSWIWWGTVSGKDTSQSSDMWTHLWGPTGTTSGTQSESTTWGTTRKVATTSPMHNSIIHNPDVAQLTRPCAWWRCFWNALAMVCRLHLASTFPQQRHDLVTPTWAILVVMIWSVTSCDFAATQCALVV